jgi:hypothetical protein
MEIEPHKMVRECKALFDTSELALRTVEQKTSHFSRRPIVFYDLFFWRLKRDLDTGMDIPTVKWRLGLLLKYRQDWIAAGYGLGELIYSVSLLPNEDLTLEVKTWETSSFASEENSEFESRYSTDVSAEESDSSEVIHDLTTKENLSVDVHAEANWGWGSASADTEYSSEVNQQHKTTQGRLRKASEKVTNEISSKRSVKIAVSRETGSEEKTTRKIRNINQCHTLNVNFYQVLRMYKVATYVDDVDMILIGPEGPVPQQITIAKETKFERTVDQPWDRKDMVDKLRYSNVCLEIDPEKSEEFQSIIVRNTEPLPELTEPDLYGERHYVYRIFPDKVKTLLNYLFHFFEYGSKEPAKLALNITEASPGSMIIPKSHFLRKAIEDPIDEDTLDEIRAGYLSEAGKTMKRIEEECIEARKSIGKPLSAKTGEVLEAETGEEILMRMIPTHGVYTESMLGKCSGCEDYFEIQRQLDIELKMQKLEKTKLENEQLRLINEGKLPMPSPPASNVAINVSTPERSPEPEERPTEPT